MIPLSFQAQAVWLLQDGSDLLGVHVAHGGPGSLLDRDAHDFRALRDRQRFTMSDEGKEAMDGGKPTVACTDGRLPVLFQVR